MDKQQFHHSKGFTLVELMTTMAVGATLFHTGITSLQATLITTQLSTQANQLMHSIMLARSEAIKRNTRITLSKLGDGWEDGWIGYIDNNANAQRDDDEEILITQGKLPAQMTLTGNRYVKDYISYTGGGRSEKINGAFQAGRLMLCDRSAEATPEHARAIIIAASGRPRASYKKRDLKDCLKGRS